MKLPRNVGGHELARALTCLGYQLQRQRGSHMTLMTPFHGRHSITVPEHRPIKPGTLNQLLKQIAEHHGMTREELISALKL